MTDSDHDSHELRERLEEKYENGCELPPGAIRSLSLAALLQAGQQVEAFLAELAKDRDTLAKYEMLPSYIDLAAAYLTRLAHRVTDGPQEQGLRLSGDEAWALALAAIHLESPADNFILLAIVGEPPSDKEVEDVLLTAETWFSDGVPWEH